MYTIINIYTESRSLDSVVNKLKRMEEVVDLYEVTGDYDVVAIVRSKNQKDLREFIKNKMLRIEGIKGTNTVVILHVAKREGKEVED